MRESATKKVIAESLKRRMLRHDLTDITVTDLCTDAEINPARSTGTSRTSTSS